MANLFVTDVEAPASADEHVEEFADFLDQLEDANDYPRAPRPRTGPRRIRPTRPTPNRRANRTPFKTWMSRRSCPRFRGTM